MTGNEQMQNGSSGLEQLMEMALKAISNADAGAAFARVEDLRSQHPSAADAELVENLIKQKTMQAGLVGAVTSAAAFIPGVGTLAAFTLGVATDVGMTLKMQSELVLEIAAVHGYDLSQQERRNAMMMVTGVNLGSERLVNQAGRRLAQKVTQRFAGRAFVKVIPFVGMAASAGANMVTTYAVGKRADAYFSLDPNSDHNWDESVRAISGLDERKLADWLAEVMGDLGRVLGDGAHLTGRSVARWGRAASTAAAGGVDAMRTRSPQLSFRPTWRRNRSSDGDIDGGLLDDQATA